MQICPPQPSISWTGRNLGHGVMAGIAILIRTPSAYLVIFDAGLFLDVGDLIGELSMPELNIGVVGFLIVFLVFGALSAFASQKACNLG